MASVTGFGGIFLRAEDPKALYQWYERHLGLVTQGAFAYPTHATRSGRLRPFQTGLVIGIGWNAALFSLTMATEIVLFGRIWRAWQLQSPWRRLCFSCSSHCSAAWTSTERSCSAHCSITYGKRSLSLRSLSVLLLFGLTLFVVFMLVRVSTNTIAALGESVTCKMPHGFEWASVFYAYLAGNFWNLDFAIRRYAEGMWCYPMSWGYELFRPVLFFLRLDGPIMRAYGFDTGYNESVVKAAVSNSVVYVWHFYKDFGIVDVLLIPLLFGVALSLYHANTLRRATLVRVSVLGVLCGTLVFSYMVPLWDSWATWANIALLVFAHRRGPAMSPSRVMPARAQS